MVKVILVIYLIEMNLVFDGNGYLENCIDVLRCR